uniref:Uncharacterized LOC114657012 n=1 Tax=Erpetoichthys calabaricus TaxID=27687 RepID=A0A8C4SEL7_ERPCA
MAGVSGTAGSCEPPKKAEEQEESEQRALLWEAAKIRTDSEVNVAPDGDEVCQQVPPLERACEEHSVEIVDPEEETPGEQECPICTELYDTDEHPRALLNCGHVMCNQCLNTLLKGNGEADIGRVSCPICRQKTPICILLIFLPVIVLLWPDHLSYAAGGTAGKHRSHGSFLGTRGSTRRRTCHCWLNLPGVL